jgi:hypothetical protein
LKKVIVNIVLWPKNVPSYRLGVALESLVHCGPVLR